MEDERDGTARLVDDEGELRVDDLVEELRLGLGIDREPGLVNAGPRGSATSTRTPR